jgi:predicted DNA-binding protein YlxM (UPF0122 family)
MSIADTNKKLQELQDELSCLREAEQHLQGKIDALLSQLNQELIAEPQNEDIETKPHDPLSLDELANLVRKFEAQHPALTDSVNRVLLTLSNMGI